MARCYMLHTARTNVQQNVECRSSKVWLADIVAGFSHFTDHPSLKVYSLVPAVAAMTKAQCWLNGIAQQQ